MDRTDRNDCDKICNFVRTVIFMRPEPRHCKSIPVCLDRGASEDEREDTCGTKSGDEDNGGTDGDEEGAAEDGGGEAPVKG